MASGKIRFLGVHGLGDHRNSTWKDTWASSIQKAFPVPKDISLEFRFITYDDIFENVDISFGESVEALFKLGKSGISSIGRRQRGVISDISDKLRWTAGYVVAWLSDAAFQRQSRKRVLDAVQEHAPDVILAHSLGSLITYNAFSDPGAEGEAVSAILGKARYVTLGSQIGNPFVISNLTPGRIEPLPVRFWHHLYNAHDDVFTAPLRLWNVPNFRQIDTPFDVDGIADHAAECYLAHPSTVEELWRTIGEEAADRKAFGPARSASRGRLAKPAGKARRSKAAGKAAARRTRRALLVGINDYPQERDRLEGCINDVFTMSSVLQECGFEPQDIRTCLDRRATANGILTRLKWLLDDPQPGDERVFYYSGHGARIPEYGEKYEPDHHVETLVPWDFDWSAEKAITDDQIFSLYSQLPYGFRFAMIFDCCHSGGIHKDGGAKVRGLTPPDDIRHRELEWNRLKQMWVPRGFARINRQFSAQEDVGVRYFGKDGATERLGRASMLRNISAAGYSQMKKRKGNEIVGPYLPLIIEACAEEQLSYEYRHGVTSHGAFTFCLSRILREQKRISFEKLVSRVREDLAYLQYDQTPQILGPSIIVKARVPWVPVNQQV